MMLDRCPGGSLLRTPTLEIRKCPQCGEELEVFSNDLSVKCSNCGFVVYNDVQSCARWCSRARECLGEEMYKKYTTGKEQPP
jgi:NADH pyrophosphatase NudC (nudix superfamily)